MKVVEMRLEGPPLELGPAGAVVTVGTFDGVHLGHRKVLAEIVQRSRSSGRNSVLVTFDPHPLKVIRPEQAPPLLTTLEEKIPLLEQTGIDYLCVLPFTPTLRAYSARRFATDVLLELVGMRELVMGYDHGFGRGREGSPDTMREIGGELGFEVDVVDAVVVDGEPVSSSRVRGLLSEGRVAEAGRLLARPYSLHGIVEAGAHQGRRLGFPTANVRVAGADKMLPRGGIYAGYGSVGEIRLPGLIHLGPRPTFAGLGPSVEIHLLDWSGDLYGHDLRVEFCGWLREIVAFDSVEALVDQMHRDAEAGRALLSGAGSQSACA
ncbi:MAG TPA: bifunctional riboflavin kinase/FAD synthetase [Longimicrobiaceae bacterium]